jgi:hypothetical protein
MRLMREIIGKWKWPGCSGLRILTIDMGVQGPRAVKSAEREAAEAINGSKRLGHWLPGRSTEFGEP